MGRPPLAAKDRKSKGVLVRLTLRDLRALAADAKAAGLPVATYLRECWREKHEKGKRP